jgi:chemotaxis protein CheZ
MVTPTPAPNSPELESLFDSVSREHFRPTEYTAPTGDACHRDDVHARLGRLVRELHDTLRSLGFEKSLCELAADIPDTNKRLSYVADLTEKAANKVITLSETVRPLVDAHQRESDTLHARWQDVLAGRVPVAEFRELALATVAHLARGKDALTEVKAALFDILMAQDFQDLTGQVIKRIVELTTSLEEQLVHLLQDTAPPGAKPAAGVVMHGPAIDAEAGALTNQDEVDSLLKDLGF